MPEAATIDAPPATEKPATPPPSHPGSVMIDLGNLGNKAKAVQTPPVEAPKEEKPPEVKPTEPPPAEKKPNDKEENMANLRKAREAAEAARKAAEEERDRLKSEFEEFRKKPAELPEEVKSKLTKAEQLEKDLEEHRRTIRQLDLSRDPEFQAKYDKQITERITTMGQTALAAGISEADWKNAVANWDENQFAEWTEAMPPVMKVKFTAAWTSAVDLHQKKQSELSNADQTYQQIQKQRQAEAEEQQKRYLSENEKLARSVMATALNPEAVKEYEDLAPAAEAILMKAARHELPAKDIFEQLVANQTLARVTVKQRSRIEELEATLAERDKKIQEQDQFIASHAGAVPRGDAAGSSAPSGGKTAPVWNNIVVKTPG